MATAAIRQAEDVALHEIARFPRMRALYWAGDVLYASRGYDLLRAKISGRAIQWELVAQFRPEWWRKVSSSFALSSRLCRDGFHALAVLPSGDLVGAVPGAIVASRAGKSEFCVSHRLQRGTRPLHIACTPEGNCFWGEYFDNSDRDEVHIYGSSDRGANWVIAYTFAAGEIRHVHNVVYDQFENCLWILAGDEGRECRILRASCDFRSVDVVLAGNQQARAAALVPTRDALYVSSDTPFEQNYIYRLDRTGRLTQLTPVSSSSIYGCAAGDALFFSTMVEPSAANPDQHVRLYGSHDGDHWRSLLAWQKDGLHARLFQYGNAFLPDGDNTADFLAVSTIAVKNGDIETTLWRVTT